MLRIILLQNLVQNDIDQDFIEMVSQYGSGILCNEMVNIDRHIATEKELEDDEIIEMIENNDENHDFKNEIFSGAETKKKLQLVRQLNSLNTYLIFLAQSKLSNFLIDKRLEENLRNNLYNLNKVKRNMPGKQTKITDF